MRYVLSYVNLPDGDIQLDKEFPTVVALMAWVNTNYPAFTSYQVICLIVLVKVAGAMRAYGVTIL